MADEDKILDMIQQASYFHDDLLATEFASKPGKHTRLEMNDFNDTYAMEETKDHFKSLLDKEAVTLDPIEMQMFMEELENVIREKDVPLPPEPDPIPDIEELKLSDGPSSDETSDSEDSYEGEAIPHQ